MTTTPFVGTPSIVTLPVICGASRVMAGTHPTRSVTDIAALSMIIAFRM
jgi:hypothetical protein